MSPYSQALTSTAGAECGLLCQLLLFLPNHFISSMVYQQTPAKKMIKDAKRHSPFPSLSGAGSASDDLELLLSKPSPQKHQSWYWRGQTWGPQPAADPFSFVQCLPTISCCTTDLHWHGYRYPGCIRGFCLPIFRLISDPVAQRKRSRAEIG